MPASASSLGVINALRRYEVLGVQCTANADEIRMAFRKRALQKHADKEGGDKHAYQSLDEAFHVFFDARHRAKYDGDLQFRGSRDRLKCCAPSAASDAFSECG